MLKKKIMGLFLTLKEDLTIKQIAGYTNEKESVILTKVNQLIKEGKIQWTS